MPPKKRQILIALSAASLCACAPRQEQAPGNYNTAQNTSQAPASPTPSPKATATPNAVGSLKLSQAVGQRIIYAYDGLTPPARLRELIRRGEVGGIILFKRNVGSSARLAATMRELQAIRRPRGLEAPLLVMTDQEGGQVKRLPGPPMLSPRQIGRSGSAQTARREGVEAGRYLLSCGVNVNLAPVVDVARAGTYQEKTSRAYGRDAKLVANMARAFADGMASEGVSACFKHFPGLGAGAANEDLKINRMELARKTLDSVDLLPFRQAGTGSMVMTSTGVYPLLDSQPALFSRRVVMGELRGRLGFRGISITDDLEVPAMQSFGTTTERGRRAILAGNDILLYCASLDEGAKALRGLTKLYEQNRLDRRDLYETTARVLAFRARLAKSGIPRG